MLRNLRTYTMSVDLHRASEKAAIPAYLKRQLLKAAASISLNIAEGYGKDSPADRRRYFFIALGSLREVQAAIELAGDRHSALARLADQVGASLYRLCNPKR